MGKIIFDDDTSIKVKKDEISEICESSNEEEYLVAIIIAYLKLRYKEHSKGRSLSAKVLDTNLIYLKTVELLRHLNIADIISFFSDMLIS